MNKYVKYISLGALGIAVVGLGLKIGLHASYAHDDDDDKEYCHEYKGKYGHKKGGMHGMMMHGLMMEGLIDANQDGTISDEEKRDFFQQTLNGFDADGSGGLNHDEMMQAMLQHKFSFLDKNQDNSLSLEEFGQMHQYMGKKMRKKHQYHDHEMTMDDFISMSQKRGWMKHGGKHSCHHDDD